MKYIDEGTQPEVSTTRENTTESMLGWETQKKNARLGKYGWENARLGKYA